MVYAEYSTAALLSWRGRCVLCMRLLCIRHDSNRVRGDVPRRRPTPQGTSGMRSKTLTEIVLGVGIAHWDSVASDAWKGTPEKDRKGRKRKEGCEREEEMSLYDTGKAMIYISTWLMKFQWVSRKYAIIFTTDWKILINYITAIKLF